MKSMTWLSLGQITSEILIWEVREIYRIWISHFCPMISWTKQQGLPQTLQYALRDASTRETSSAGIHQRRQGLAAQLQTSPVWITRSTIDARLTTPRLGIDYLLAHSRRTPADHSRLWLWAWMEPWLTSNPNLTLRRAKHVTIPSRLQARHRLATCFTSHLLHWQMQLCHTSQLEMIWSREMMLSIASLLQALP